MIIAGPGVARGRTTNACSLVDLLPTMVDIGGGTAEMFGAPVDGRSLMPLARGEDDEVSEAIGEYCAEMTGHPVFMIRRGDLKYIHCDSAPPSSMICSTIPGSVQTLLDNLLTPTLWTALPKK